MSRLFLLAGVVGLALLYARGWVRLGRRAATPPPLRQPMLAMGGLVTVVIALASPLDDLAHHHFSAHMLQHVLLTMAAAPLLLLADPLAAAVWALPRPARHGIGRMLSREGWPRRLLRVLTNPALAWLAHAGALWLWHVPTLYDAALADDAIHTLEHAMFFGTAVLFWWPVIHPAPRCRPPISAGARIIYLTLATFQSAGLGLLLAVSPRPLYAAYAVTPQALDDQARGGLVMWGLGGAIDMLAVLLALWSFLARDERGAIDPPRRVRDNELV